MPIAQSYQLDDNACCCQQDTTTGMQHAVSFSSDQPCDNQRRKAKVAEVFASHTVTASQPHTHTHTQVAFNTRTAGTSSMIACKTALCKDCDTTLCTWSPSVCFNPRLSCYDNGTTWRNKHLCTVSSFACCAEAHLCNTLAGLAMCICNFIARRIPSAVVCLAQQPIHARL